MWRMTWRAQSNCPYRARWAIAPINMLACPSSHRDMNHPLAAVMDAFCLVLRPSRIP